MTRAVAEIVVKYIAEIGIGTEKSMLNVVNRGQFWLKTINLSRIVVSYRSTRKWQVYKEMP